MTKRDRIELLRRSARTGLTGLVFLIIGGTGLFVAGITWSAGTDWEGPGDGYACTYPPAGHGGQQSMTPNGQPPGEPSDHLILPLIIKTDNSDKRPAAADRAYFHTCRRAGEVRDRTSPCSST
ncbi:MAG TPA: hypothetical protein PK112_08345, partial [candidate division Zixibacteria bacterium]|nr:hypothetical protein [candidate division Zixibacteria bacterium]